MKKLTLQTFLGLGVLLAATAFTCFASYLYAGGLTQSLGVLGVA